ncbi:MAG: N-acetylmuramoyl-L-alanine amidase family protein [Oscillospiraceae bacterium]
MKINRIFSVISAAALAITMATTTVYADEWVKIDKGYVYEYTDGTTAKQGWLTIDNNIYYIQKNGTCKTGWLKTKSAKYYFGKDGKMYKSKWLKLKSGKKYFLRSNGKAAIGVVKIGDVEYKFDENGVCLGENCHFVLNKETQCLHANPNCFAAEKIDKKNYAEIDIGTNELSSYSEDEYWACGVRGCNNTNARKALPKPKKKK